MRRFGTITKVKDSKLKEYIALHDNIPPEVVEAAARYGLRNFSIYYWDGYLFSYFEYEGDDYDADMAEKAKLAVMQKWECDCNDCFETMNDMEDFSIMLQEIFHNDFEQI